MAAPRISLDRPDKWREESDSLTCTINGHRLVVRRPDYFQTHWTAKIDGGDIAPGRFDSDTAAKEAATRRARSR